MANDTIGIMPTIVQLHDIIILSMRRLVSMANPRTKCLFHRHCTILAFQEMVDYRVMHGT